MDRAGWLHAAYRHYLARELPRDVERLARLVRQLRRVAELDGKRLHELRDAVRELEDATKRRRPSISPPPFRAPWS